MSDPCEYCLNNQQDEYGSWYCAEGGALDEDEMARYLSHTTSACPYFEPDRKSTRLNSSHIEESRMPSSA